MKWKREEFSYPIKLLNNYLNKHSIYFVCFWLSQTGHLWIMNFLGEKPILPNPGYKILYKQPPLLPLMETNATKEHFSYALYTQTATTPQDLRIWGCGARTFIPKSKQTNQAHLKNIFIYPQYFEVFPKADAPDWSLITILFYSQKITLALSYSKNIFLKLCQLFSSSPFPNKGAK